MAVRLDFAGSDRVSALIEKVNQTLQRTAGSARQVSSETKRGERSLRDSFGSRAQAELTGFATRLVSVQAAFQAVTRAVREFNRERDTAFQRLKQQEAPVAELAQLAVGDPREFRRLRQLSQRAAVGAGISRPEAARLVFNLQSAQALQELPLFTRLAGVQAFGDTGALITAGTAFRRLPGTGNLQTVISQALGASGFSPARATDLLLRAAQPGTAAEALGVSGPEVLGALARVSEATGDPARAATNLENFFRAVERISLEKPTRGDRAVGRLPIQARGLRGILGELRQREEQGFSVAQILRDAQAIAGFRQLARDPDLDTAIQAAERGGRRDAVFGVLQTLEKDPQQRALRVQRQQAIARDVASTDLGLEGARLDSARQAFETESLRRGLGLAERLLIRGTGEAFAFGADVIGVDPESGFRAGTRLGAATFSDIENVPDANAATGARTVDKLDEVLQEIKRLNSRPRPAVTIEQ